MKLPGKGDLPLRAFLRELFQQYLRNGVGDSAAQVAYYLFFALFPFLFFLATLAAYLPLDRAANEITARLSQVLPGNASQLVSEHVHSLLSRPRPRLLALAFIGALWSASRAVDAIRIALNLAYDVKETRSWWKTQVLAVAVTGVGAILGLLSVTILMAGGDLGFRVARFMGVEWTYHHVAVWLRWPVTAVVVTLVAALTYYLLPDVKQRFKYITPGSICATIIWLAATWGFGFYSSKWGGYEVTYGSLGGVIVLLTWFLISASVFLVGGEINAILEHESVEGKAKGEHAAGEGTDKPGDSANPTSASDETASKARRGEAAISLDQHPSIPKDQSVTHLDSRVD